MAPRSRGSFGWAVVGGGVVGSAIAYGLASRGASVVLLDEGDVAYRASRGSFGLVWVQGKGQGLSDYAALTLRAASDWHGFARDLEITSGVDPGYRKTGGLSLCLDQKEFDARAGLLARLAAQGPGGANDARMIEHSELRRHCPAVSDSVLGGAYCPHDGHADPLALLCALRLAGERLGVTYASNARVGGIEHIGSFWLTTAKGTYDAEHVVLAAGLSNRMLAPLLGLEALVVPSRGQVLVTERVPPFLPLACHQVRQTPQGTVMLGDTKEDVGFDLGTTVRAMTFMAARAARAFPVLERARVMRQWSALRVMTPDGAPIYQRSREFKNAYLMTCHSGVTLAAAHAGEVSQSLMAGDLQRRYAAFSPHRFVQARAA